MSSEKQSKVLNKEVLGQEFYFRVLIGRESGRQNSSKGSYRKKDISLVQVGGGGGIRLN